MGTRVLAQHLLRREPNRQRRAVVLDQLVHLVAVRGGTAESVRAERPLAELHLVATLLADCRLTHCTLCGRFGAPEIRPVSSAACWLISGVLSIAPGCGGVGGAPAGPLGGRGG